MRMTAGELDFSDDALMDDFLFADEASSDESGSTKKPSATPWRVVIVDDEPSVISVTKLSLRNFTVDQRPVEIVGLSSASEAKDYFSTCTDVAVMITDVVMESEHAGLELIRWVREHKSLDPMRLIVRTGQPGQAPPDEVISDFDVNDYWAKTDITPHRMKTILSGLIRSFKDIETVREQSLLLKEMQAKLFDQERIKVVDRLMSGVAHDFNNALTPIIAYASMLATMDGIEMEEVKELSTIIHESAQDAAGIVKRLKRDFGANRSSADFETVPLRNVLKGIVSMSSSFVERRVARGHGWVEVILDYDGEGQLTCNPSEIRQAGLNLVINAIDAIVDSGTVHVDAVVNPEAIEIRVRDDGPGMSPELLERCTQPFFTTKGALGTGVGLSTVRETCKQHNGRLQIDSEVGVGTQMTMILPNNDSSN